MAGIPFRKRTGDLFHESVPLSIGFWLLTLDSGLQTAKMPPFNHPEYLSEV